MSTGTLFPWSRLVVASTEARLLAIDSEVARVLADIAALTLVGEYAAADALEYRLQALEAEQESLVRSLRERASVGDVLAGRVRALRVVGV